MQNELFILRSCVLFVCEVQSAEPVTVVHVVFCPDKEKSCHSLDLLNNGDTTKIKKVLPVQAADENAALDVMKLALSHGKVDGIVIDPEAPREVGGKSYSQNNMLCWHHH